MTNYTLFFSVSDLRGRRRGQPSFIRMFVAFRPSTGPPAKASALFVDPDHTDMERTSTSPQE